MTQTHSKHTQKAKYTQHDAKFKFISVSRWRGAAKSWAVCVWMCFVLSISAVLAVFGEKDRGSIGFDHVASKLPHSLSHTHTNSHRHTHRGSRGLSGATVSVLSLLTKSDNASCDKLLFRGTFQKQIYLLHDHLRRKKTTLSFLLSLSISLSLSPQSSCEWNCTLKQSRESRAH